MDQLFYVTVRANMNYEEKITPVTVERETEKMYFLGNETYFRRIRKDEIGTVRSDYGHSKSIWVTSPEEATRALQILRTDMRDRIRSILDEQQELLGQIDMALASGK